jgi:Tfp pilus assembly protein PilX
MSIMKHTIKAEDVRRLAGSYQRMLAEYGENNMATQRAEWAYREAQEKYNATHAKKM